MISVYNIRDRMEGMFVITNMARASGNGVSGHAELGHGGVERGRR